MRAADDHLKRPRSGTLFSWFALALMLATLKVALLAMPPVELTPVHVPGSVPGLPGFEEWRRGMAAEELLRGPLVPVLDLQQGHFQGGTLVTVFLDAAAFQVLGPSPFAMRLPNLLFDAAALIALMLLVRRIAGERAATWAGIFAVAAAPGYWMVGACAWASHVESNAQALVILYLWARHVFWGRAGARPAFVLGACAGLALWYHYGVALWLGVLLVVEAAHAPRRLVSKEMAWRIVGVLVGLIPWFVYNVRYDWAGLGLYGKSASAHVAGGLDASREAFVELWTHFLPRSIWLPVEGPLGRVLEALLLALAVLAWAALLVGAVRRWRHDRARAAPRLALALYPPFWCAAYIFGSFHGDEKWVQGYRYMMSVHPVAWAAAGVALGSGALAPWRRMQVAAVGLAALLVASTLAFLRPEHMPLAFEAPSRNLESLGRFLYERRLESPDVLAEAAQRLVEERSSHEADTVLFTLGMTLAYQADLAPLGIPPGADESRRALELERAEAARVARERIAPVVPPAYRPYFEPLRPGERAWPWRLRDRFWSQWDERGDGRPEGALAH